MALTSVVTFALSILLAVFGIFGLSLFWGRIYRPGWFNFIIRFVLLILVNALALAAIGIGINRSQGFYSSWSDLVGSSQNLSAKAISYNSLLPPNTLGASTRLSNGYHLVKETIHGGQSNVAQQVYLLLPPSAVSSLKRGKALAAHKYRVVEFLTGFPSQPIMWIKALSAHETVARYNAAHPQREIIGVIPQVNIEGNFDLECMNLPGNHLPAETWLTEDIHHYVQERLGLPAQRFIAAGVSTGAWCAAMFAIKHPALYSGALSIAGYYRPALPLKDPQKLQDQMKIVYDLAPMEQRLKMKVPIYMVASLGDKYSIRETTRYLAKPHPNLVISYHQISQGGHNPRVWRDSIEAGLSWVMQKKA